MKKLSKNSKIECSIIIVNFNTDDLLRACLKSIVDTTNQLTDPRCEIILIDNASTDNSLEKAKRALSRFFSNSKILVFQNKTNKGFARAVNQGIRLSKGQYKLLLNPDTVVLKGAIKNLLEFAKKTPRAGVVGARLLNSDGSLQKSVMPFPTVWRAIKEFWFGQPVYSIYAPDTDNPIIVEAVVGAAFLITPQALQLVGLMDERYFIYFEDLDYCRRVKKAGLKVFYLPSARIIHYKGISGRHLAAPAAQWKRLVPSSKIYHGLLTYYLIFLIVWLRNILSRYLKW